MTASATCDLANARRKLLKCLIPQAFKGSLGLHRNRPDISTDRLETGAPTSLASDLHPSKAAFSLAAFQVITYGRIEVFTEATQAFGA